jgi:dCTP deaminase
MPDPAARDRSGRPSFLSTILGRRRGILVDRDIRNAIRRGEVVVTDLDWSSVRPAALGLRLGDQAYVLSTTQPMDVADGSTYPELVPRPLDGQGRIVLRPGEVLLARTLERIGLGERLAGLLDGTSDYARLGISVVLCHQVSPGYGMPGGSPLTLEIVSRLPYEVYLRPGVRIANLMLLRGNRVVQSYREMTAHHSSPGWSVGSRLSEVVDATREMPS